MKPLPSQKLITDFVLNLQKFMANLLFTLSLSVVSNDAWNIFEKRGMHFIHLNMNSLLPKIDEIRYIAKLVNATVIGLSETKLDDVVLSSELEIDGYDLVRPDRSRRGGGVACFVKLYFI